MWQRASPWMLWLCLAVLVLMLAIELVVALVGQSGDTFGWHLFWGFFAPWTVGLGFVVAVIGRTRHKLTLFLALLLVAGVGIVSFQRIESFGHDQRVRDDIPVLEAAYQAWLAGQPLEPPVTRAGYAGAFPEKQAFEIVWGADGFHRNGSMFVPSDTEPNREWLPFHRCRKVEEHFYYCSA